jgi:hypothetical protein
MSVRWSKGVRFINEQHAAKGPVKIYKALGVISKGHLIEADRAKLVAAYVGQTAIKTTEVITDERQSQTPEPAVPKAKVIEIPGAANSTATKMLPPTIFILANGERLETRRYVLTASNLSVSIDRQQRTVPRDLLDINAIITANHERGIDLRIPADRNEISLSF